MSKKCELRARIVSLCEDLWSNGDSWPYSVVGYTAERILALLRVGPVVEIEHCDDYTSEGEPVCCGADCVFHWDEDGVCNLDGSTSNSLPTEDCPGPAPEGYEYRLVLVPTE